MGRVGAAVTGEAWPVFEAGPAPAADAMTGGVEAGASLEVRAAGMGRVGADSATGEVEVVLEAGPAPADWAPTGEAGEQAQSSKSML